MLFKKKKIKILYTSLKHEYYNNNIIDFLGYRTIGVKCEHGQHVPNRDLSQPCKPNRKKKRFHQTEHIHMLRSSRNA